MTSAKGEHSGNGCRCWISVLATVFILFSIFDIGFGVLSGSVADAIAELGDEVSSEKTGMRIAKVFRTLTDGYVNLGRSAIGAQIEQLVKDLPSLWMLAVFAWGRVLLSIIGLLLGCAFAMRWRTSLQAILVYALVSLIWGVASLIYSQGVYTVMFDNGAAIDAIIVYALNLLFHVIWPVFLGITIWKGRRSGAFSDW